MSSYQRKQFWVDPALQLQILGYVLVLVTASLLLVAFSVLRGVAQASARSNQLFHSIDWFRQSLAAPLVVSSCTAILACGVIALLWSHRLAGPLRVLSAGFSRLKEGDLSATVRIRATDTHQELVRDFAQAQAGLRDRLANDRRRLEDVRRRLQDAAGRSPSPELESIAQELSSILSGFKL